MSQAKIDILQRALEREKAARKSAEEILDEKSRHLYFLSEKLKKTNLKLAGLLDEKSSQLQGVFKNINDAYLVIDLSGNVLKMNDIAVDLFGYDIKKEKFNVTNLIYHKMSLCCSFGLNAWAYVCIALLGCVCVWVFCLHSF